MVAILLQLDLTRIIQIFVAQGIFGVFFLVLGIKTATKGLKGSKLFLSLFFIVVFIGIIINMIYAPLTNEDLVWTLNAMTNFCFFFSPTFLTIFCFVTYKKEEVNWYIIGTFLISYLVAILLCIILIPNNVTINESTNWKPVWSTDFYAMISLIVLIFAIVPTYYFGNKLLKSYKDYPDIRYRWLKILIGMIFVYIFMYGTITANWLNNQDFRNIWVIPGAVSAIGGAWLIYTGATK